VAVISPQKTSPPKFTAVNEQWTLDDAVEHDAEAGVLKGVKILGLHSRNNRSYDTDGVRSRGAALMEGARVYVDHADTPRASRSYRDSFGVFEGVSFVAGKGFYGTLRYNREHGLARQFEWDVKNAPRSLGFSINANVRLGGTDGAGRRVVEGIEEIRSVDLVSRPATTSGVFEEETAPAQSEEAEEQVMSAEQKQVLEAELADLKAKLAEAERFRVKAEVVAQFQPLVEGLAVDKAVSGSVIECACQSPQVRESLAGVLEAVLKRLKEIEASADSAVEAEKLTDPSPGYKPGKREPAGKFPGFSEILKG
jgi:hypothetical protein